MFTENQITELLKNKNVTKCNSKSIAFSKDFKISAVKKYYDDGYSPKMIFEEAGIGIDIIGKPSVKDCLLRWRKTFKGRGEEGLLRQKKPNSGRKPKLKFKNKDEEMEYLRTKIDYLEAENDFLAKLRGLKRE